MISEDESLYKLYNYKYIIICILIIIVIIVYFYYNKEIKYDDLFKNMNVYYINLNRSPERKQNVEFICKHQNLIPKRIEAIDSKDIDINDEKYQKAIHKIKWWFLKNNMNNLGHFGCYLSHMKTYETFLRSNEEYCLIFEDDISLITNDIKKEIHKNMNNLPKDWNILLLGYEIDGGKKRVKEGNKNLKLKNGLLNITYFVGLHAYIINRKTAKILLENLQTLEWIIDWNICYLADRGLLNIYGVFPPLVCQPAVHMIDTNDIYYNYGCPNNYSTLTNK